MNSSNNLPQFNAALSDPYSGPSSSTNQTHQCGVSECPQPYRGMTVERVELPLHHLYLDFQSNYLRQDTDTVYVVPGLPDSQGNQPVITRYSCTGDTGLTVEHYRHLRAGLHSAELLVKRQEILFEMQDRMDSGCAEEDDYKSAQQGYTAVLKSVSRKKPEPDYAERLRQRPKRGVRKEPDYAERERLRQRPEHGKHQYNQRNSQSRLTGLFLRCFHCRE